MTRLIRTAFGVVLFAIAFAFAESSVVVYLRELYYPDGFAFPLRPIANHHLAVELLREFSTILMLMAVGLVAGKSRWERTAWFMIAFGIWDLFYYVWLKAILDWPASLVDWDILFLIPVPWISPVIAPVAISVVLVLAGGLIIARERKSPFSPPGVSWVLAVGGTVAILFSFMKDTGATLGSAMPEPFSYGWFSSGVLCYLVGMFFAFQRQPEVGS